MATRKPKAEKVASDNDLLDALKFISAAQHSEGTTLQTHCRISGGTIVGFDGGLTIGRYIEKGLNVCPHTNTLIAALSKCTEAVSITELDSGRLSVKSGKFRALVPCAAYDDIPASEPDTPCATLTDDLKAALRAVVGLADPSAAEPFACGVLMQANTVVTTNRFVLLEAWHGIDLPPGLLIPKPAVLAICKHEKPLTQFGFSHNSATFYFADDSFIKTQLYMNDFPNYHKIINIDSNPKPLPVGFYEALDSITPFAEEKRVYFRGGKLCTHSVDELGASFEVDGLEDGHAFNIEYLKIIRTHMKQVHFGVEGKGQTVFFGDGVRGVIMPIRV